MKRAASGEIDGHSKKRRCLPRGVQGVHAADMSLVTPENAATRPGWHVTALGRVIHPIRMRPDHPLPDPQGVADAAGKSQAGGRKRKRVKEPPTRARKRKIDPTKWGSVHLEGAFLENTIVADIPRSAFPIVPQPSLPVEDENSTSGSDRSEGEDPPDTDDPALDVNVLVPGPTPSRRSSSQHGADTSHGLPRTELTRTRKPDDTHTDLREETQKSLGILETLFGDKGDDDWGERESISSGIDADISTQGLHATAATEAKQDEVAASADDVSVESASNGLEHKVASAPLQNANLKDLFAPREDDGVFKPCLFHHVDIYARCSSAGFSLLGHLDLDLELDDEVDLQLPAQTQTQPEHHALPPTTVQTSPSFDPKAPLFFPPLPEQHNRGRVHDVLDPTSWQTWFYRTDDDDAIQKRWEEAKGELTAEWKRRHREAVKSRRRRGGGTGDAEL